MLDNKEPCETDDLAVEHDCPSVKKKFFMALDTVLKKFLGDKERILKLKD